MHLHNLSAFMCAPHSSRRRKGSEVKFVAIRRSDLAHESDSVRLSRQRDQTIWIRASFNSVERNESDHFAFGTNRACPLDSPHNKTGPLETNMRHIVYDVAMTLDGFIGHPDGSTDGFVPDGDHVEDYLNRLKTYDTVLMGRRTYEYGYQFGLKPGDVPYEHMENILISKSLRFESSQLRIVGQDWVALVRELKQADEGDIYLCGGGELAGTLLDHDLIDRLVIKLNPVVFGNGIKLFGQSSKNVSLKLLDVKSYDSGVALHRYEIA